MTAPSLLYPSIHDLNLSTPRSIELIRFRLHALSSPPSETEPESRLTLSKVFTSSLSIPITTLSTAIKTYNTSPTPNADDSLLLLLQNLITILTPLSKSLQFSPSLTFEFAITTNAHNQINSLLKLLDPRINAPVDDEEDDVKNAFEMIYDLVYCIVSCTKNYGVAFPYVRSGFKDNICDEDCLPKSFQFIKVNSKEELISPTSNKIIGDEDFTDITSSSKILINLIPSRQKSQDDVGFILWPSSIYLTYFIIHSYKELFHNKRILELGGGCGLTGIAGVVGGISSMLRNKDTQDTPIGSTSACEITNDGWENTSLLLTDFNVQCVNNMKVNLSINNCTPLCGVEVVDFFDFLPSKLMERESSFEDEENDDPSLPEARSTNLIDTQAIHYYRSKSGAKIPCADVIIAADIVCHEDDVTPFAHTVNTCLRPGGKAYILTASDKHRFGVGLVAEALRSVGLEVVKRQVDVKEMERMWCGGREEVLDGVGKGEGFDATMGFYWQVVTKRE